MAKKDDSDNLNPSAQSTEDLKSDREKTKEELLLEIEELRKENLRSQAYMNYLENLEAIDHVLTRSTNLEHMMKEVLETVLWAFDCDRASLLYPCDPENSYWRVPMECTRPEFPGAMSQGVDFPMSTSAADVFRLAQDSVEPVTFGPYCHYPVPDELSGRFHVKSQMITALYPWIGKPWMFVLHQCCAPRTWTGAEIRLFSEIANRLSTGLSGLLFSRDLQHSETKFKTILNAAGNISFILFDVHDDNMQISEFSAGAENIFGYKRDEIIDQPLTKLHPPGYISIILTIHRKIHLEKKGIVSKQILMRKSGQSFPAMVTLYPVFDKNDRLTSMLEVVTEHIQHPYPGKSI